MMDFGMRHIVVPAMVSLGFVMTQCNTASVENRPEKEGRGAFYTGEYRNLFAEYLGISEEETDAKIDAMWRHYFEGDEQTERLYFEKGDEAYIFDTGNEDVRTEGQSYGMMICVQMDKKEQFDKLWSFAKRNMLHSEGADAGYFSWQVRPDGSAIDEGCAPDGEMYFVASLLLASKRWGDEGTHNYNADAQYCLKNWVRGDSTSLFNEAEHVITFQPKYDNYKYSDPSYNLPGFVELFAMWSETNQEFWRACADSARSHLYKASHPQSGLFAEYSNFDGTPKRTEFNPHSHQYMFDAIRVATNISMDYQWFAADTARQAEMMRRLIDHFEKDGYAHARFEWDGTPMEGNSDPYTLGEAGANAAGCIALTGDKSNDEKIKRNLRKAWDGELMRGKWRYYDGLLHFLGMLNAGGRFRVLF